MIHDEPTLIQRFKAWIESYPPERGLVIVCGIAAALALIAAGLIWAMWQL